MRIGDWNSSTPTDRMRHHFQLGHDAARHSVQVAVYAMQELWWVPVVCVRQNKGRNEVRVRCARDNHGIDVSYSLSHQERQRTSRSTVDGGRECIKEDIRLSALKMPEQSWFDSSEISA